MRYLPASLRSLRFDPGEVGGACGDLGTFIPITASLCAVCGLDIGTVLLFAGLYNVVTGLIFNQPVPVQPMKAIAAVAIAELLTPGEIAAAGLGAGAVVFLLGATGWIEAVERLVPRPVVRGIQLGVGLKLVMKGLAMVGGRPWLMADGRLVALAAATLVLLTSRRRRFPSALVIFSAGVLLLFWSRPELLRGVADSWGGLHLILPSAAEWKVGLVRGALPQIPLTLLNSVIAVCALSGEFFPGRGIGARPMALSVGAMNLAGCWFGAMPVCHGSGGLAGQYRFGARTGGSVVMLGAAKILIALTLGGAAAVLLAAYPRSILGVLLAFAGVELALPARDCTARRDFFLAAATAGGVLGLNTAAGFLIGFCAAGVLRRRW